MKILVACEESQAVTKEFRALGHEAYSCDIQECSGGHPEWHCQEDVLPLLNGNCKFRTADGVEHSIDGKWDMVIAFPPCFVKGTKVMTYEGIKNIEDIQVGDMVLTHKGRYRAVKDVMCKITDKIATVKTRNSGIIECTPNHPFYVKNKETNDKFEWVAPKDFTQTTLVTSVADSDKNEEVEGISLNDFYIIGRWLGTENNTNTEQILIGYDSDGLVNLIDILEKENLSYDINDSTYISVNSVRLYNILKNFGIEETKKYINGNITRLKENLAKEIIKGYLDSPRDLTVYYDMKYLINKYNGSSAYVTETGLHLNINALKEDNYILTQSNVTIANRNETVYNLSVEEDESYTANGIVVHNCTHLAVSGAAWFEKKRQDGRQREGIEFFCKFLDIDCDRVAIENPVNIISGDYIPKWFPDIAKKYNFPLKPTQRIQPWYWGDNVTKTTCLWLKGLPELVPEYTEEPEMEYKEWVDKNGKKKRQMKWFFDALVQSKTPEERSRIRSKTFPGVAHAMATTWGNIKLEDEENKE